MTSASYPITIENEADIPSESIEMQVCSSSEVTENWASSQTDIFSASLTAGAAITVSVEADVIFARASATSTLSFEASLGYEKSRTVDHGKSTAKTHEVCVTVKCVASPHEKKTCLALE